MKKKYNSIKYYLELPWTYETIRSDDLEEPYTTRVKELPGCMSHGKTPEKSLHGIKDAIESFILVTMDLEEAIPEPLNVEDFKGEITYRTCPERHYEIARHAQLQGVSMNKFIDTAVQHELKTT